MRRTFRSLSKSIAAIFLTVAATAAASAQDRGRIRLDSLDQLGPKAVEAVNVEIDSLLINLAGGVLDKDDDEEKGIKELIKGLRGLYVRSYEFKAAGQYAESDLAQIRSQLSGPGWSRVMSLKNRGDDFDDAEVYAAREGDRVEGLVILAVNAKEVTVINVVGSVDLAKLQRLADGIRLPRVRIERKRGGDNKGQKP
ncbi:MAG TPA: DUF4252 domain-containing protein [Pyrinomonadaceae bacterium]|jgi:hypothetical protein|nr:DUF4252 domain-containing protein [Pyrinomonadaceae bacterium]